MSKTYVVLDFLKPNWVLRLGHLATVKLEFFLRLFNFVPQVLQLFQGLLYRLIAINGTKLKR
jgi:hypothetical protein